MLDIVIILSLLLLYRHKSVSESTINRYVIIINNDNKMMELTSCKYARK